MANFISDLQAPLVLLNGEDRLQLWQALENIHIWGASGGGKTSGSGQTLARAFLRIGAGGLVLCSKPSEVSRWQQYAAENGRENSVFVFDRNQGFNFIEYALHRYGMDSITNVVGIIMRVLDDARKARGKTGNDDSAFWDENIEEILSHCIPVQFSAYGTVTIQGILDFAVNAPVGDDKWKAALKNVEGNPAAAALRKMSEDPLHPLPNAERKRLLDFWVTGEWQMHDPKTRGNILSSLTSRLGLFRHGVLRDCFCGKTTCIPEMMFSGALILMNFPVQANETEGRLAQMVFKYMAQLAVEGRKTLPERHQQRPIFLWVDEAHRFISIKDATFLAECRENNCSCAFLSQSVPSYYAALGQSAKDAVDGLINQFNTLIFHQNGCNVTNKFASEKIGRGIQLRSTVGHNSGTNHSTTKGKNSGESRGTSSGENWGVNHGFNRGHSESSGTTRGMNQGGGSSTSSGTSGGFSHGSSHSGSGGSSSNSSQNTGWNRSKSSNSSWSHSVGSSETVSRNAGESVGSNAGGNVGRNNSQTWGSSEGESWGTSEGQSASWAEHMDYLVEPNYFATSLLSGGAHGIVTGLLWRNGEVYSNGQNYLLLGFRQ